MLKTLLRKFVFRRSVDGSNPLVVSVRAKAPHAKGAVIFLHKGLGDLLLALPALRSLMDLGPVRFFLFDLRFAQILEEHGFPREDLHPYHSLRTWLILLFGKYDYCVSFDSMYLCYPARIQMMLAHARLNVGYNSGPLPGLVQLSPAVPPDNLFVGTIFDNLARCLGVKPYPIFKPLKTDRDGPIVLHIGGRLDSTGFDKRWPIQKYVALAEQCAAQGYPVKLLWGPGDPEPKALPPVRVEFCSDVTSLMKTLSEARLFVCNNTGVLWAANIAGVETISFATPFFLPAWDPRIFRPESNHVILGDAGCSCKCYQCERGNCIHEIPVSTVLQLVDECLNVHCHAER